MGPGERAGATVPARGAREWDEELTSKKLFAQLQRAARGGHQPVVLPPPDASSAGAAGMALGPPVTGRHSRRAGGRSRRAPPAPPPSVRSFSGASSELARLQRTTMY